MSESTAGEECEFESEFSTDMFKLAQHLRNQSVNKDHTYTKDSQDDNGCCSVARCLTI